MNLTNVTLANNNITIESSSNVTVNVFWYIEVHVNDTNGNDLEDVNVTVWDRTNNQSFTLLTNSTGWTTKQVVQEYWMNSSTTFYYTNYTVNATKVVHAENTTEVNLSTNKKVYLTLTNIDTLVPTVNINTSFNNTDLNDTTPTIDFNFTDYESSTADCTLYFNDTGYNTTSGVSNNTQTDLTVSSFLPEGRYDVYINCSDLGSNIGKSEVLNITISPTYFNITLNLNPNPVSVSNNVSIYGRINRSNGKNITNNIINIYENNSLHYYNNNTRLLENTTTWWSTSWGYRTKIDKESFVSTSLNQIVVMINMSTSDHISASRMNSDCGDTRFADSNGNELYYTLETSTCNSAATIFWVWMNLTANDNTTVYAYYGNTGASLPTSYTNPDDGLVLYMHFDNSSAYGENDTYIYDFSRNGNNGNCSGTVCPAWNSSGKFGGAFDFDGSDDLINLSNASSLNLAGPLTVSAWVYPKESDKNMVFVVGSAILQFWVQSNNEIRLADANGNYVDSSASVLTLNSWNHVVGIFNGTVGTPLSLANASIYVNGVSVGNHVGGTWAPGDFSSFYIGGVPGWALVNGSLDEIRLYNRSMSADEVLAMYNSTKDHYIENHSMPRTDSYGNYNYTLQAPDTTGKYEIKVNLTYNGVNGEETAILTVQAAGCACPGLGNEWLINMSDKCNITSDCNIGTGYLNFTTDTGYFRCNATINATGMEYPITDQTIYVENNCLMTVN